MPVVSNRTPPPAPPSVVTPPVRLALVNNMPPAARAETARDLLSLLPGSPGRVTVTQHDLNRAEVDRLVTEPPDLLVVTGSEPRTERLDAEAYWPVLDRLLRWAPTATSAVLLSCLSAHAYLLAVDGIERVARPVKCHGAYPNTVVAGHPLTEGLPAVVRVPHSRSNDVPTAAIEAAGWQVHLGASAVGWTVASRLEGTCRVMLAQGHPEYGTETLLREHRRDVRRFLAGERATLPPVPVDYLGAEGANALADYEDAIARTPVTGDAPSYPFDVAARSVVNDWQEPAHRLIANWVADAQERLAVSRGR